MEHKRTRDEEDLLPRELYFGENYFHTTQLASMVQQIVEVKGEAPESLLEVGKGNGFVSDFLRKSGINVVTIDVNSFLEPDVVGSVLELDKHFERESFDCVLCAEVLEHLPFHDFETALMQMRRVARRSAIITLPNSQPLLAELQFRLKFPRLHYKEFGIRIPRRTMGTRIYEGHHWEINSEEATKLKRIRIIVGRHFGLSDDYRLRWNSYHHFFKLNCASTSNP